ncbi:uncharacterized protein LOC118443930 isoform X2 [Vespa mandarinia]|uniref:uncharacterized protein LOC118443930 isoform X2 n=1 Tax=Vespa mandarinia TaxID=7446 RepID=UPI00161230A5|nr:uncharacterized protein LOC118443930 isoform X2 [Vespa mandarinia]
MMITIMRRHVVVFLCLVIIVEFLSCSAEDKRIGIVLFGDPCERDFNCIKNAYCRSQRICQCEQYYSPNPEKTVCLATAGLSCNDDSACATMSNAVCRQNVCSCKDAFTLDINNSSNCISRPSKEGDACQRRDDCEEAMERAICIDNKCRCITGLRFVNETGKCIQARGRYNTCTKDYECFLDDGTPNVLQCKNDECVCRDNDPRCSSSVAATTIGLIVSTIIVTRIA